MKKPRANRTANPAYAAGMAALRFGNAAGPHPFRYTRRARTRGQGHRRAIEASLRGD